MSDNEENVTPEPLTEEEINNLPAGDRVDYQREHGPITPDAPQESTTGGPVDEEGQVANPDADDVQGDEAATAENEAAKRADLEAEKE